MGTPLKSKRISSANGKLLSKEEQEIFSKVLLSKIPLLAAYVDANIRYRYVNTTYEAWFGVQAEDCIGRSLVKVLGNKYFDSVKDLFFRALRGEELRFEATIDCKDGSSKPIEVHYIPDFDAEGAVVGVIAIAQDISDKAKRTEQLAQALKLTRLIQAIDQAIAISDDVDLLVNNVLRLVISESEWSVAGFWFVDKSKESLTLAAVKSRRDEQFEVFLDATRNAVFHPGRGLPGRILSTKRAALISDLALDSNFPRQASARAVGLVSGVAFPILLHGEVLGLVEFFSTTQKLKVQSMEMDFDSIGKRLGQALEKLQIKKTMELERKKSASNAERFEKVFRYFPNPILIFSDSGILECNDAATKILGFNSKKELLQHHPAEFSPEYQPDGRSSKEKSQEMDRLASIQGKHIFEWVHQKRDGTEFLVEVSLSHVSWGDKNALLVIWNDLSDKRRHELQMIQTSKLASLGEMSAGIAHEINNPLAIIVGSLGFLDRLKNDPARFQAKIESMQKSCERISKIVSGLKKFSRSGEHSVMSEFSLGAIITEAMVLLESKLSRSNCQIICELEDDCIVYCNEIEIEQVIVNLVHNAADAVKSCEKKWVKISLFKLPDEVVLRVMDSGPGIPENIRRKLFDPFFTTKRVGEGTGLGLSISKGILDEHKATISILEKSSNTCFEIRFPRVVKNVKSA